MSYVGTASRALLIALTSAVHAQTFKNPKPALAAALAESGPMENGTKKKGDESAKKKKRSDRGVSKISHEHLRTRLTHPYRSTWRSSPTIFSA